MLTSPLVKERASALGFDLCGIAPADDVEELARLPQWLARGFGGRMTYLNRTARVRADVRRWLPSARSVVAVACLYNTDQPPSRRDRRPGRCAHRALRVGRRLPRRDGRPPRGAGRLDAGTVRRGVRRALVRRRWARAGEGVRVAGRPRVDRQEHVRHQSRISARGSCSASWRATSTSSPMGRRSTSAAPAGSASTRARPARSPSRMCSMRGAACRT